MNKGGASMTPTAVILIVVVGAVTLIAGLLIGYIYRKSVGEKIIGNAEQVAQNLILDAEKKSETIEKEITLEAKEEAHRVRNDVEKEVRERRNELTRSERRIAQKEETVDRKLSSIEKKEEDLAKKQIEISKQKEELDSFLEKKIVELEKISGLTAEEAKQLLLTEIEKDVRHDASLMIKDIEMKAKEEADIKAKDIIVGAIQRCAADQVAESTVSVVQLPNDEMKGRIIGREGRNIRAIETQTGVDLIIDDTPEAVIVSCFDPVRREIARLALEKLITDGRIHPARIEEMVNKATKEVNSIIKSEGERATFEVGIHNLHPELVKIVGRMKYRSSYGQNLLQHARETANLCGIMAAELGLNPKKAKRAGLLHDIGKVPQVETETPHALLGMEWAEKYGEKPEVCNAIGAHHDEIEMTSLLSPIVQVCDAISGARPGARRQVLDSYIQRLKDLEDAAFTFQGVKKAYAMIKTFGCDKLSSKDLSNLCTKLLINQEEIDDDLLLNLVFTSIINGCQEEIILDFAAKKYNGSSKNMYLLLEKAIEVGAKTADLEERLLAQMLFSNHSEHIDQTFYWYISRMKVSDTLVKAFFSLKSYAYFVEHEDTSLQVFEYLEASMETSSNIQKIPLLYAMALTKYYTTKDILSERQKALAKSLVFLLIEEDILFDYYKKLAKFIPIPEEILESSILVYHTKGEEIFLHSKVSPYDKEYHRDNIRNMYQNFYVATKTLFSGEQWDYKIYSENNGIPLLEGSLKGEVIDHHQEDSRFICLNKLASIPKSHLQAELENYVCKDAMTKLLFTIQTKGSKD